MTSPSIDCLKAGNERYDRERALQEERTKASAQAKLEELSRLAKRKASELESEDRETGSAGQSSSSPDHNDAISEPTMKKTKKNKKSKKSKNKKRKESSVE